MTRLENFPTACEAMRESLSKAPFIKKAVEACSEENARLYFKMASADFTIPRQPLDLASEDCDYEIRVTNLTSLASLEQDSIKAFAHGKLVRHA